MAATKDIIINAYESKDIEIICKDKNGTIVPLTGYTASSEIRENPTDTTALATFTCTVDAPNGKVSLSMSSIESGKLNSHPKCYWDIFLKAPDNKVRKIVTGKVKVAASATRP